MKVLKNKWLSFLNMIKESQSLLENN